jgi:hypothetical protein
LLELAQKYIDAAPLAAHVVAEVLLKDFLVDVFGVTMDH